MKKTAILLILSLLFSLSACVQAPAPTQSTTVPTVATTAPTTQPTVVTTEPAMVPVTTAPLISVSLPTSTETVYANNGTEIFSYTFQNINLITQDGDVADLVIIDFLNRIDATRLTADRIYALAASAYTGQSSWQPYMCMISYAPTRIDPGVLSLFGTQAGYYGSTHPETVYSAVNYDLVTGLPLSLGDILQEDATPDMLLNGVLSDLVSREKELFLYSDYAATVREHFSGSGIQNSWYFSEEGLCFYFTPYEIAPYATGVVVACIPYNALAGILQDAYFPGEQDTANGTLKAIPFSQEALSQFQRFTELVQDSDEENILIYTDASVRNLRIETGIWSATGTFYTPQHTIFAASALSAGDALMIQAQITQQNPQLRIRYETDAGTKIFFITKDDSGKPILKAQ